MPACILPSVPQNVRRQSSYNLIIQLEKNYIVITLMLHQTLCSDHIQGMQTWVNSNNDNDNNDKDEYNLNDHGLYHYNNLFITLLCVRRDQGSINWFLLIIYLFLIIIYTLLHMIYTVYWKRNLSYYMSQRQSERQFS